MNRTIRILQTFARHSERNAQLLAESLRQIEPSELQLTKEELTKLRQDCQSLIRTSRDFQRRYCHD